MATHPSPPSDIPFTPQRRSMGQPLTVLQKQRLMSEHDRRRALKESSTHLALANWAQTTFRLQKAPDETTISRLLPAKSEFINLPPTACPRFKSRRTPVAPRIEATLHSWLSDRAANRVQINDVVLRFQAERLQKEANKHLPSDQQLNLKFSNGGLNRFQKSHSITYLRVHGEAMSADELGLINAFPEIKAKVAEFGPRDVWNAEKFGLFIRQPPGWSLSPKPPSGFKKDKTRITVLACCNFDGSEKFPLMMIGNPVRPRPFRGKYGHDFGFDNHANMKAWMRQDLFFARLGRLDAYVRRTPNRKILLFIDNCSAHGPHGMLPEISKVEVYFLPPNTTSRLQPLDAGIISAVEAKYRRRLLFRVFDNIDAGKNSIYNIDILTAMRWRTEEWEGLAASSVLSCFRHCFEQNVLDDGEHNNDVQRSPREQIVRDLNEHGVRYTRVGIENLLNPLEEDEVTEVVSLEHQAAFWQAMIA